MKLFNGLFDSMVVQRNRRNVSQAAFEGECATEGQVLAKVHHQGRIVKGFAAYRAGQAQRGRLRGSLNGLPMGGPYDVELWILTNAGATDESVSIKDILVGDVWILGGQSNMQGCGRQQKPDRPDSQVRAFYMDDRWRVAREPIHNLSDAIDPVHVDRCGGVRPPRPSCVCVGPGVFFAKALRRLTGVPQGVLACAHGGTSMAEWDPGRKKMGSRSFYGALLRRFRKNGGRIAGLVWYQGCAEASAESASRYLEKMRGFIRSLRRDLGDARLPFVMAQICRYCTNDLDSRSWNQVQDMQRRLQELVPHCATVSTIDLELEDIIHLNAASQERLGGRLAQAMRALREGPRAGKLPPALKCVVARKDPLGAGSIVEVTFKHVIGALQSAGRPAGFQLGAPIFDIRLDGYKAILRVGIPPADIHSAYLHYGYGSVPYCNITDSADRALPVLGPLSLGKPEANTSYIQNVRLSDIWPGGGRLETLRCPSSSSIATWKTKGFAGGRFCDLHRELGARAPQDTHVFMACRLQCVEPMKLAARLGYDGPVKVWIDDTLLFHDPSGTNPATPDRATIPFQVGIGHHEVVVALGSNQGQAWGIFLRFKRLDLSKLLLQRGANFYRMPDVMTDWGQSG